MEIKNKYDELSKKYDLPSYEELDDEFELLYFQNILEINYPLRFVRRRIMDKMNGFINFFQNILSPAAGNLVTMEESGFLSKEEKDEIVILIKNMIRLERESLLLDINQDDKEDAEFIKKAYSQWKTHKVKIESYIKKLRDGWNKEGKTEDKEDQFFG